MNILELKRKSLGWVARDDTGGGGGGPSVSSGDGGSVTSGDGSRVTSGNYGQVSGTTGMLGDAKNLGLSPGSPSPDGSPVGGWASLSPSDPNFMGPQNPNAPTFDSVVSKLGLSQEDRDTLHAINPTQSDLASLSAAHDLGYSADGTRGLLSRLGMIPGMSQDSFLSLEAKVPGAAQERFGAFLSPMNAIGQIAMQANPAYGLFRGVADVTNNMQAGMSFGDAAYGAVKDRVAGIVAGKVNQAVGAAIGPGLGQYNKAASVANIFGAGMPSINPGGIVANAAFGKPSSPQATASNGGGLTSPDGSAVQGNSSGGWSSGSSGSVHKDLAPAMQVEDQKPAEVSTFTPKKFKDISYADWRKEH